MVIGVGLNVATSEKALPVSPTGLPATSLLVEGADVGREALLAEILRSLERWYLRFSADPDPVSSGLLAEYRAACATLGRQVRVELPAGRVLAGLAEDVDPSGRLLVRPAGRGVRHPGLGRRRHPPALESGASAPQVAAAIYVDRICVDPIYVDSVYLSASPGWRVGTSYDVRYGW